MPNVSLPEYVLGHQADNVIVSRAALTTPEQTAEATEGVTDSERQSFDEVVENCLRIWFFNYDEAADNSAYRVAMREIVKFVRSVSIGEA